MKRIIILVFIILLLILLSNCDVFGPTGPKEANGYIYTIISIQNVSDSTKAFQDAFNKAVKEFDDYLILDSLKTNLIKPTWIVFSLNTLTVEFSYKIDF